MTIHKEIDRKEGIIMITFKVSYDAYDKIEELWSTDELKIN